MAISASEISARIVEAVMAQKLAPGARLPPNALASKRTLYRNMQAARYGLVLSMHRHLVFSSASV